MKVETYRQEVEALEAAFARTYTAEQKKRLWDEIRHEDDRAMVGIARDLLLVTNGLPAPAQLLKAVREQGVRLRLEEGRQLEEKAKREKAEFKQLSQMQGASEFARMCVALIQELVQGKINRETYLLTARLIAEQYGKAEMLAGVDEALQQLYARRRVAA